MPQTDDANAAAILIKLGEMGAQLAVIGEQLKSIPDHEQRIRDLERGRWPLPAVCALCTVLSGAAAWLSFLIHH